MSLTDGSGARKRRILAVGVTGAVGLIRVSWVVVGAIALGQFDSVPEQGFCRQPEVAYGVALLVLAVLGLSTAGWTTRQAIRVALGRIAGQPYITGLLVTAVLIIAFVVIVVPLNPAGDFGPC